MKKQTINRRRALEVLGKAVIGIWAFMAIRPVKAVLNSTPVQVIKEMAQKSSIASLAPKGYDPLDHHWIYAVDIEKCIGCGLCVEACKTENHVIREPFYFRTWVERYIIKKPKPGSGEARGETIVDCPKGGIEGFPPGAVPKAEILKSFFVPKLCNHCENSPCVQACPVGATFDTPDGVVLVDPKYCIGCGFCIQTCPYGCRFINPITNTAEKCTFCYHRITRGLQPGCVEVCPTGARLFGDLKNSTEDSPIRQFIQKNKVQVLKPHLGTHPKLLYSELDKEVS